MSSMKVLMSFCEKIKNYVEKAEKKRNVREKQQILGNGQFLQDGEDFLRKVNVSLFLEVEAGFMQEIQKCLQSLGIREPKSQKP